MFKIPLCFITPDLLYSEALSKDYPELPNLGLDILGIKPKYMEYAYTLSNFYSRNSTYDLFALALAKQENCPLLTDNSQLREAAESENISVQDTLWIIEELFNRKLLNYTQCNSTYLKIRNSHKSLPWCRVEDQLERFKLSVFNSH